MKPNEVASPVTGREGYLAELGHLSSVPGQHYSTPHASCIPKSKMQMNELTCSTGGRKDSVLFYTGSVQLLCNIHTLKALLCNIRMLNVNLESVCFPFSLTFQCSLGTPV